MRVSRLDIWEEKKTLKQNKAAERDLASDIATLPEAIGLNLFLGCFLSTSISKESFIR